MRNALFGLFTFIIFIFSVSCDAAIEADRSVDTKLSSRSIDTLTYSTGEGFVLFLRPADTSFYLLQLSSPVTVPTHAAFVSFIGGVLAIRDLSTAVIQYYALSTDIYGIGYYKGQKHTDLLTTTTPGGFVLLEDPPIEQLSCRCYPDDVVHATSCTAGGEGATECEITDGGETGPLGWHNHCGVSCRDGYFACCNE